MIVRKCHGYTINLAFQSLIEASMTETYPLVMQYSSVPGAGSTLARLAAGVVALASARRRLG